MNKLMPILLISMSLTNQLAHADDTLIETIPDTEPTKCYELAWGSTDDGGLGLTAGQAINLCGGANDARKVLLCFVKAWAHSDNDGLGLTAGQAIELCRDNNTRI